MRRDFLFFFDCFPARLKQPQVCPENTDRLLNLLSTDIQQFVFYTLTIQQFFSQGQRGVIVVIARFKPQS